MAHVLTVQTSTSSFTSHKQYFPIFIGSSILMFIVIITIILCFVDRLHKTTKNHQINLMEC
jgi:hypothetical protein